MKICFASFRAFLTSIMVVDCLLRLISAVQYHLYTALLFTWTDYKTIFLPIVRPSLCLTFNAHSVEYRPSLLVQRHPHNHGRAFSCAAYGCGSTSSYAMYPTKHAVATKTKSTIHGDLSRLGESLNLKRVPYAGPSSLVVSLYPQCTTKNWYSQLSASSPSPSRMTNSAGRATSLEKLSVPPEDTYLSKSALRQSSVCHAVTMCRDSRPSFLLASSALTDN